MTSLGFAVEWSTTQKNKCHVWEKGLSSHHEVVFGNKDLGTSALIFLSLLSIEWTAYSWLPPFCSHSHLGVFIQKHHFGE